MSWRTVLIDGPTAVAEVAAAWYRLYVIALLWVVVLTAPTMALATLVLWFVFGVRWGW